MIENHPPRRPAHRRDHAAVHAPDDRERRAQARRVAEVLFAPNPRVTEKPAASLAEDVLLAVPVPAQREAIEAPTQPEPPPAKAIPATHLPRIRTWLRYGMTIAQVAAAYGVDAGEIAKLLGKREPQASPAS